VEVRDIVIQTGADKDLVQLDTTAENVPISLSADELFEEDTK